MFSRSTGDFGAFFFFLLVTTCSSSTSAMSLPSTARTTPAQISLAKQALAYFDAGTDPFHVVQTSIQRLGDGFVPFTGKIEPGGRYYFTKNRSTLVAWTVGKKYEAGNALKIIGAHTDSPNLRIKPRSKRSAAGWLQIGVECYGGGLWHTWFDRDLGISGRVFVRKDEGKIEQKLVKVDKAVLRIPNLAIHLQTAEERKAFKVNKEDHLSPVLAMEVEKTLTGKDGDGKNATKDGWTEHQEPALLHLLASELSCNVTDIVDFELSLFDIQKGDLGGIFDEFCNSARLDNLGSCFIAVQALVDHAKDKLDDDKSISMIILYDHEEVGSGSAVGACSPILEDAIRRICFAVHGTNDPSIYDACIERSFCLSSDQAHAVHPNYASKHEKNHQPKMNDGMVIKRNANQRYATNGLTGIIIREIARRGRLPAIQEFIVRQDCGCGSTIGPAISQATGIRTIDMGCPQLSMHSIREQMGVCDLTAGLDLFKAYFELFDAVDESVES